MLRAAWPSLLRLSGHPPFGAQIILNGHEYVASQGAKQGLSFTKEGNCFTQVDSAVELARVADTVSDPRVSGHLSQQGTDHSPPAPRKGGEGHDLPGTCGLEADR